MPETVLAIFEAAIAVPRDMRIFLLSIRRRAASSVPSGNDTANPALLPGPLALRTLSRALLGHAESQFYAEEAATIRKRTSTPAPPFAVTISSAPPMRRASPKQTHNASSA